MAKLNYGYVRSWDDLKYLQQLQDQGYAGALFEMDEPRLAQEVAQAQQMGLNYGIWGAPNQTPNGETLDPIAYANRMLATAKQYGANTAALDLEFPYKGGPGTPGWIANQQLANYWKANAPQGMQTIITPMGSQWAGQSGNVQDFNFGAWNGIANGWNPQAYGATLDSHQDPAMVVKALMNAGIDPSLISPVLAPGQTYGGGALYGLNEYGDLPKVSPQGLQAQVGGGQAAPTTTTNSPIGDQVRQMAQRLSQSQQQVQQSGLRWYGNTYTDPAAFRAALAAHGGNYNTWAQQHPYAA